MPKTVKNATATPFTVNRGYYAVAAENEAIYYTPNPIVGEEAAHKVWVEHDLSIVTEVIGDGYDAECRVNAYEKKFVKAKCPQGWSAVVMHVEEVGNDVIAKVKQVLYTRPLRVVDDLDMQCLIRFFRSEGMSVKVANATFLEELKHICKTPMRVFDVFESHEKVPKGRWMDPNLSIREAHYASLCHKHLVYCQEPFRFFWKTEYPVFFMGEILRTVEQLRQNDTFRIALPQ